MGKNRVPRVVNKLEEDATKSPTNCNRKRPPDEHEPVATKTATPDPESFQGQYKQRKRARIATEKQRKETQHAQTNEVNTGNAMAEMRRPPQTRDPLIKARALTMTSKRIEGSVKASPRNSNTLELNRGEKSKGQKFKKEGQQQHRV